MVFSKRTVVLQNRSPLFNYRPALFFLIVLCFWFSAGNRTVVYAESKGFERFGQNQETDSDVDRYLSIIAELSPNSVAVGEEITLTILGRTEPDYHIYSVFSQGDFSPEPTRIVIESEFLEASSKVSESSPLLIIDKSFDQSLHVHKNDFWLKQKFILKSNPLNREFHVRGYLLYQICDNRICSLPRKKAFRTILNIAE